ncbi:ChaN family lipoprotein [Plastorhodobacter daqingensis]|uniref:ChaN family lipoprotein n=1 Tax=Plastorhodobacter daqingensis TaxID=1387281 RepID=A0ABW2UGQ9_9RHOB
MKRWLASFVIAMIPLGGAATEITPEALEMLPPADVVILGEVHDNPVHHANQARAVRALAPRALVFEMLTPEQAAAGASAPRTDADALSQALGWEGSGWPSFTLYHPMFMAAPEARIYGGALPRDEVRRAMQDGAAAVFGEDAATYGLARPLPDREQDLREQEQFAAHCAALPRDMLPGMVEAQRLRDAALARAALQAMEQTGGPVAVITGTGHARRDWGIPAKLARVAPGLSVLALGQFEGAPEADPPFDLWIVTDAPEREDPCASFGPFGGSG